MATAHGTARVWTSERVSRARVLVPLALVLVVVSATSAGPTWARLVATVLSAVSAVVVSGVLRRAEAWWLGTGIVLQVLAVAVLEHASSAETPTVVWLVLVPAIGLSHGFHGRALPFVAGLALTVVVLAGTLTLDGATQPRWLENGRALVLTFVVATVVLGIARRARDQSRDLTLALDEATTAVRTTQVISDAIDVGITFCAPDGEVRVRNTAMEAFRRRTRDGSGSGEGRHVYRPDRETPIPPDEQPFARMLRGETVQGDLIFVGPPGDQTALSCSATALTGPGGPDGYVLVCHDVTALVNAVTIREDMILTFTHELRTPLTSIIGFAEDLQDSVDLEGLGIAAPVEVIHRNAVHLASIVSELLRAGTSATTLPRLRDGDLVAVVHEAVTMLGCPPYPRGVTVEVEVGAAGTTAVMDPALVRQALANILSNALKFSDAGGVVHVIVEGTEADVSVTVHDDGPGIDPQDVAQLFQRGFRSVGVQRKAVPGLGLGLPVARDIALAHGGGVLVDTSPGAGTTMTLRLPRTGAPSPT